MNSKIPPRLKCLGSQDCMILISTTNLFIAVSRKEVYTKFVFYVSLKTVYSERLGFPLIFKVGLTVKNSQVVTPNQGSQTRNKFPQELKKTLYLK